MLSSASTAPSFGIACMMRNVLLGLLRVQVRLEDVVGVAVREPDVAGGQLLDVATTR